MRLGVAELGVTPFSGAGYSKNATLSAFQVLLAGPEEDRRWIIKAYAVDSTGSAATQYWSQKCQPPLSLTNLFKDRVGRALSFETSIFAGRLQLSGVSRPDFGAITVERDIQDDTTLTDLLWDGRAVEVYVGDKDWTESQYELQLKASVANISWNESAFTLRLLDTGLDLQEPLQSAVYLGTGGIEGSENLTDQRKPFCYGRCDNVEPRLVDSALNIYQVHDRTISAVRAVYDGGAAITFDSDVGDVTAWTAVEGSYVTDLAEGLIRLGAPPVSTVTADIDGDADGGFVSTTGDIIKRLLTQRAGYASSQIDGGAFFVLNRDRPEVKGVYSQGGGESIEAVINQLSLPATYFRFDRTGRATVGLLKLGGSAMTIDEDKILSLRSIESPQPVHRVELGYQRAWRVMGDSEFVGSASDDFREFASQEFRVSEAEDTAIDTLRANSTELVVQTLFHEKYAGDNESARLLAMLSMDARLWEVRCVRSQIKVVPGQTVTLDSPSYARTTGGLSCIALRVREDSASNETLFTLWG